MRTNKQLESWINTIIENVQPKFSSHLYSETEKSALQVNEVKPNYDNDAPQVDGRIIIRDNFDSIFSNHPEVLVFWRRYW